MPKSPAPVAGISPSASTQAGESSHPAAARVIQPRFATACPRFRPPA